MEKEEKLSMNGKCVWVNGPVIVGAGPSGLAVAACLREHGVPFVNLERSDCIASLWQNKTYDRLKLHLPKQFCQLPKLPFPSHYPDYPSKNQFLDYLHTYARNFDIVPRFNECVRSARYDHSCKLWRVRTVNTKCQDHQLDYICHWLVIATGENAETAAPEMEGMDDFGGSIMHASDYKSGHTFRGKDVLVVGCGNSGMEVCLDLYHHHAFPSMVVRDSVHVLPREIFGKSTFSLSMTMLRWMPVWMVDKILLVLARMVHGDLEKYGLKRPSIGPLELKNKQGKTPVLDLGALGKIKSGEIKVVTGIKRFLPGKVELVDGRVLSMDSVILATGYRSNVSSWLQDCDFFSKDGFLKDWNGWKGKNGLYAVGFTRRGLSGASMDAVRIADDIGKVWREETRQTNKNPDCLHL